MLPSAIQLQKSSWPMWLHRSCKPQIKIFIYDEGKHNEGLSCVLTFTINWSDGLSQDAVQLFKSYYMYYVKFSQIIVN